MNRCALPDLALFIARGIAIAFLALTAILLAGCAVERPEPIPVNRPLSDLEGYIIDVCLEREGRARKTCIEEAPRNVQSAYPGSQPWFCEDYETERETPPKDCIREIKGEPS